MSGNRQMANAILNFHFDFLTPSLICLTMMDDHHCLDQTNATLSNSSKASLNSAFFNRSSSVSFILSSPRHCILKTSSNACIPCSKITRNDLTQLWAPLLLWHPPLSLRLFLKPPPLWWLTAQPFCPQHYLFLTSKILEMCYIVGISGWCVASFKIQSSKTWYTYHEGILPQKNKRIWRKGWNSGVRYPIWFNSMFKILPKNNSFNIRFNIALPKIQFKILFN